MFTTAVAARKGGVGKSTLSFSLACDAAENGYRTLLVSADPQGDSAKWAKGLDARIRPDEHFTSGYGFDVRFTSHVPEAAEVTEYDLMVVDLPPVAEAIRWVRPNLWLIPIDGRNALEDTMPIFGPMMLQGGRLVFVPNKADVAGTGVEAMIRAGLDSVAQLHRDSIVLAGVPESSAVARVAEYGAPPWKVPYGARTAGANAVAEVCAFVRAAVGPPQPRGRRGRASGQAARRGY